MYWGIGAPKIQELDSNDAVINTFEPDNTNKRNLIPYEMVSDNRVNPIDKRIIQRIFGYRPVFRFFWIVKRDEFEKMDMLNYIANLTSNKLKLYPHKELIHLWYHVYITNVKTGYSRDTTMLNEIEIEFKGALVDEIPFYNPIIAAPHSMND